MRASTLWLVLSMPPYFKCFDKNFLVYLAYAPLLFYPKKETTIDTVESLFDFFQEVF